MVAITAVVVALAWFVYDGQQNPITFGYDRDGMLEQWNAAVAAADQPALLVGEFQWTDEDAGVFGFAFSETMSLLGRVDGTPLEDVEEIALVGSRSEDGIEAIVAGMRLVVEITESGLNDDQRTELLSDLTVIGIVPADPDRRVTVGTTRYRVAADPANGILGIGAVPAAVGD